MLVSLLGCKIQRIRTNYGMFYDVLATACAQRLKHTLRVHEHTVWKIKLNQTFTNMQHLTQFGVTTCNLASAVRIMNVTFHDPTCAQRLKSHELVIYEHSTFAYYSSPFQFLILAERVGQDILHKNISNKNILCMFRTN